MDKKVREFYAKGEQKTDSLLRKLGWKLQRLADRPTTLAVLAIAFLLMALLIIVASL